MKYFEIIHAPTNSSGKEWFHTEDVNKAQAIKNYSGGVLISCTEIEEEDYEMPEHLR